MAPRKKAAAGPTPVEVIAHQDTRSNIPTADAEEFLDPDSILPKDFRHERNPSLDPQLVWRGKDGQDASDLLADAPPIFIQEKIDPRALIENLRRTAERPEDEPELALFDTFDGLDELAQVEFYQHPANWSNRMILGDSLNVMASLAEREALRGKVQMIYIDPPYGIKFGSNWQPSARSRDVKDGKLEDVAREAEQIKAFRDTWALGIHSYLAYLRDRLIVARDLLTESGSCFVQIGDENVHLVRALMDEVFGSENFVITVIFRTTANLVADALGRNSDYVIWYAKDFAQSKLRKLYRQRTLADDVGGRYARVEDPDGNRRSMTAAERRDSSQIPVADRPYRHDNLTSQGATTTGTVGFEFEGVTYWPGAARHWTTAIAGLQKLGSASRLVAPTANSLQYVRYLDDFPLSEFANVWTDTATGAFTDDKVYVVQTNTKVIHRCMLMCTDPGDLVLDPTCGSGTTAFVAEQWGRRWITIDTSRVALALARQRLMGARYPYYLLADSAAGKAKEAELTGRPARPEPPTDDVRLGFVYERVQHITLKSIANNPDIREGMTRAEIDEAIKRHADYEYLYDKPYENNSKVRVTGRFTVESLSPHRSLAFAGSGGDPETESISETAAALDPESPTFEQTILDNLAKAGIQNGRRNERIEFAAVESYAGNYVQAVGERRADADADNAKIGIAIGPQYGTVSPAFVRDAAREAIRAGNIDLLCVLAFAFDPGATGVTEDDGVTVEATDDGFANVAGQRKVGRIQVLFVRMNADLLMGDELKTTASANLFTVFGEPDIDVETNDEGKVVVTLNGVDVYDPTTGVIRSDDTDRIALWMIDTNYDETSFYVRHCYFTGGNDPYRRLKTSLRTDIDAAAWEALYRTESMAFDRPDSGRIAIKVINDYGDEVMKVFEV